jgi:hypothetical protein
MNHAYSGDRFFGCDAFSATHSKRFGDVIEGSLNNLEHVMLHDARFFADTDHHVTLCHT